MAIFFDMGLEEGPSKSPSNTGFLRYVELSEFKKVITALRRTPRRGDFLDAQLSDIYADLSDRTMQPDDTIETFATRVLDNLHNEQRNEHVSTGELAGTLPGDGNTYGHSKLQRSIAKKYMTHDLDGGLLSADDMELLDLAFLIHDVGEALRGDVAFPDKHMSSEEFERQCGEYLFQKILKPKYRDPHAPEYKRLHEAYDVNFNDSHRLHSVFRLYEQYSYLNGAIVASQKPDAIVEAPAMVQEVLRNTLPSVIEKKSQFPSAAAFLKDNMSAINEMFGFVERDLYAKQAQQKSAESRPEIEKTEENVAQEECAKHLYLKYAHAKNMRFSAIVNEFYHQQHLKNGLKKTSLVDDNLFQVLYPKTTDKAAFLEWFALHVFSSFTEVVPITRPYTEYKFKNLKNGEAVSLPTAREKHEQLLQFEQQMKEVILALRDRSVMFVFDHPTFANIPVWIGQLFYYAKLFGMEYVVDNIHTVLGPALMTQSHRKIILAISKILKTIPNTDNAKLPIPKRILLQIGLEFKKVFAEKSSQAGNIFLLAPTGKRDINLWKPNGEISSINFGNDTYGNIPSSLKLIEDFANQKREGLVVMVGTNETDLKSGILEKGNDWNKGNMYVSMKILHKDEVNSLIKAEQFMPTLASLVKDRYGNQVGNASDEETLKMLACQKEASSLSQRNDEFVPGIDFKDNYSKMLTRKIFNLLKDYNEWDVKSQIARIFKKKCL